MDEYVKRAAIMEFPIRKDHCDKERANEHFIFGIESVLEYVQNLPAADVVPVAHGEWLLKHIGVGHYWECSVCHTNPCIYVTEHTKFCPNCGARMDGGADNAKAD